MGHLTVFFARTAGHLTKDFQKSQMPRGLPGGGGMIAVGIDSYISCTHNMQNVMLYNSEKLLTPCHRFANI